MTGRRWETGALALALVTVAVTAAVAQGVFEAIPHLEDEFAQLWQAHVFADGSLSMPTPAAAKSFIVPFVVDLDGIRFSKYPPGWSALLSVGARLGQAWLINPLLAGLAVWLTFRLSRRYLTGVLAFLAAMLLASSPMFLMLSGTFMSHNLSLVMTIAFALAWLDLLTPITARTRMWCALAVAGGSLGILLLTRPLTGAGVALPFAVFGVSSSEGRRRWRWLLGAIAGAGVIGLILPLWQGAVSGDLLLNPYTLWWPYDRLGFGPDIGAGAAGHSPRQAYINTKFSLRAGLHDIHGWPYLSWLFLPLGLWGLRRQRGVYPVLAVFPVLVLAYGLYWVGAWLFGPRYYFAGLPGWCLASAAGIGWLGGWLSPGAGRRWRKLTISALVAGLLAVSLVGYSPTRLGGMKGLFGIERAALNPLRSADLEHVLIIVRADHWSDYANLLPLAPPFTDQDVRVAWSRGPRADAELAEIYSGYEVFWHDPERPAVLLVPRQGTSDP